MGNLSTPESRIGLIGNQANLCDEPAGSRSHPLESGLKRLCRILPLLALCALAVHAQVKTQVQASPVQQADTQTQQPAPGSIHGLIVDQDGAAVQGARISLTLDASAATSVTETTSDSNGRFDFAGVPLGGFKLAVSSNGFATRIVSGELHSGESYDAQSIALIPAAAANEVQVTASQEEIAEAQIKMEETQRVLGVIPNFYVSYAPHPSPLTTKQKFELAWKTSIDPVSFLSSGAYAGVEQANDDFSGYGEGAQGYAERFAANYADNFIGGMIGSALLPSLLKQDPRYFYKGTGTIPSRVLYALANSVVCKGDNGHWQANYSGILGGLAAGGISNLYYPADNRDGVRLTFENALAGIATGAAQNLFQEFVIRKLTPKLPDYGTSKP